ncbi:Gfo/Idh/MocA family oxidoreductase [Shouchella clausii]|jgi:UDP-N-acetyl-2-amino-2-deoxyglucuronate dehydrogenase|uniref:Oxidoreductase n=2 Tax=Shouchella TaxID=2893057 RepID=Q5WKG0_SHOC1|nr:MULTISPECIES: Gfo/Idh/MocA family oxidoreductase [Shouchella]MCM3314451.1 Gfo/Idh/MocA family oxidoreductase [Psychrobacillus sp. MER TA 17]ALA52250.1 Oxidoreductase [Shouchella clausii]MBU3230313.1 Gfo/Idh/MocA family oxidoreductase [Shouchella clausii]MBU3262488.1 Gfo/Idh/MocA family oxidoreductase [Shouchella clausii]MBU3507197.1 Gfo/Idh/MocA family oxidoreductase [Shouchella clausii]
MMNVAIIGTGAICPSHIKGYLEFQDRCKITALCDIYPEKAEAQAKEFDLNVAIYSDYKELLRQENIDLVSVCTPPYTHAAITIEALNQGKNVIVEKPMASSLKECDAMNEAAKRSGKILSVVAQNRFTSPMMKLKHVLDTKLMGPIVHTQVDSFWWRGHCYYDLWWRGTWEKEGGGCTLNHAVHHIDIFRWMNGMPSEITAVMSNVAHDNAEVEDISIAIGRYENGSLAQITSSVVHHGEEQQLIFQGKNARVSVPWKLKASKSLDNGFPVEDKELQEKLQKEYESINDLEYEGHAGQIEDVLHAIEGKKEVLVDGNEGRETLELITAIFESASLGKTVKLPLDETSPFYSREGIIENATYFYEKKTSIENFKVNEITTGGKYE